MPGAPSSPLNASIAATLRNEDRQLLLVDEEQPPPLGPKRFSEIEALSEAEVPIPMPLNERASSAHSEASVSSAASGRTAKAVRMSALNLVTRGVEYWSGRMSSRSSLASSPARSPSAIDVMPFLGQPSPQNSSASLIRQASSTSSATTGGYESAASLEAQSPEEEPPRTPPRRHTSTSSPPPPAAGAEAQAIAYAAHVASMSLLDGASPSPIEEERGRPSTSMPPREDGRPPPPPPRRYDLLQVQCGGVGCMHFLEVSVPRATRTNGETVSTVLKCPECKSVNTMRIKRARGGEPPRPTSPTGRALRIKAISFAK